MEMIAFDSHKRYTPALVLCVGFRRREERAWDSYWGNIDRIYKLLHDTGEPVQGGWRA